MKLHRLLLSAAAMYAAQPQLHATSPAFGNIDIVQNAAGNATTAVTASLSYTQVAISADGSSSLGGLNLRTGSNRGDFLVRFTASAANDRAEGILISNIAQLARDNSAVGDPAGAVFSNSTTNHDANGYLISVFGVTADGPEFNANVAAAWFPYADGWIGGHAVNATNGGLLTDMASSPGLTLSTTAAGPNTLYDPGATGFYELNIAGVNSQTDGILIVNGGKNEDNYALSKANADGTWTIQVHDNFSGGGAEADGFAFVYIPQSSTVSGNTPGVHAMGRLNGNLTRDVSGGNYAMVRTSTGSYRLYAPGINPAQASLFLSHEAAGVGADNAWYYEPTTKGWNLEYRDLPGLTLQDNTATEDTLSFALMASYNSAAIWDAGGANTNWGTTANWQGDAAPIAGRDVVVGAGTGNIQIDSPQSAGMLFVSRDVGFTLSGSALTLSTGLIVNAQPAANQTYIVSAPLVFTDDGVIIAQSLSSSTVTLRLDVASGNAITAVNKNVTLAGGGAIEIRDPISLGSGQLIKEGAGQVTLLAANSIGGTTIVSGPSTQGSGAFRLNAPAAYGAFGTGDIVLQNLGDVSALYVDSGAGSGTLTNNIVLQSANADSGTRFVVDSAATMNVTLSGLLSGGNATSEFFVASDAANGQGKLHLTNTNNTFIAERIHVTRGAVVIYGDGSLGASTNGIYLNTSNTNGNTGSGLHFGADNITVAATRTVEIATDSVINTGIFQATIAGTVTGTGSLMKAGSGTLTLTGANTYSGATSVLEGTLSLRAPSGSATGTGPVTVLSGAAISGSGQIADLYLQGGSTVKLAAQSGTSYDHLQVGGTLQVGATTTLQFTLQYTPQAGDTFDLFDWNALTDDTNIVDNLSVPDLSGFNLQWDFSSFNTLGILSIQAVPEPSRMLLLMLGMTFGFFRRRR